MSILTGIANNSAVKGAVNWAAKDGAKNLGTLKNHLPAVMGIYMTSFYAINNLSSDKIPKERKIPLLINDIICCAFGTFGGYLLSDGIFTFQRALATRFEKVVADHPKKLVMSKGLKSIVPLLAFTFMFRYIGPVFAVPLADKITKGLIKHGVIKDPAKVSKQKAMEKQAEQANNTISATKITGNKLDMSIVAGPPKGAPQSPAFNQFLEFYKKTHNGATPS